MKQIKKILNDLYLIDPELKKHEKALEKLVLELINTKPDTKFDSAFARSLKQRILAAEEAPAASKPVFHFSIQRMAFAFGGLTLAVLLVFAAYSGLGQLPGAQVTTSGNQKISRLSMKAFGPLTSAPTGGERGSAAFGMGGGSGAPESAPSATDQAAPMAKGLGGGGVSSMIYPYYSYNFVYKGEPVELKDATLDVYKRIPPSVEDNQMVSALSQVGFGANLNSFSGSDLTSFELIQNTKDGYVVNVNVREGMVSIYQNWATWNECVNNVCPTYEPLKMENIPADDSMITLANQFLAAHAVNLQNYDKPVIDNEWRKAYAQPALREGETMPALYVPDVITVIYPQKVNGQVVTDMGGGIRGIRVSIDIRKNKVSNVWGIMTQDYQSSAYEAETSFDRILKFAQNGGVYGRPYYAEGENVTQVELNLQTPKRVLTTVWSKDGEIVVPALEFEVTGPQDKPYWVNKVTVPLVKDLLNENQGVDGPVRIMGGATGSAGAAVDMVAPSEPATTPAAKPKQ